MPKNDSVQAANMDPTHNDPNLKLTRPDEPELDLYTIPSYSGWFAWDDIHETERSALKEFFDGNSITRTPRIYKEYRDFIINKYREDPSRRVTFTEIRKSLIGDVTLLHRVFQFLDKWGLINFGANSTCDGLEEDEKPGKVRVEDGAPNGIRVVAMPNSLKPILAPPQILEVVENGKKLPPLSSFSDVFGEHKGLLCCNCGVTCDSGRYEETTKGDYVICVTCFNNGSCGENKSKDDFKRIDGGGSSGTQRTKWTEAETLILLESVLRHGDDWDLVAQNVKTKTKLDCVSKLIELPFGDLILSSTYGRGNAKYSKQGLLSSSSDHQDGIENAKQVNEGTSVNEKNGNAVNKGPPLKRKRIASLSSADNSLMKQVALISTVVGPDITAAAADAAVATLCDETSCPREMFDGEEDFPNNGLGSPISHSMEESAHEVEDSEMKEKPSQSGTRKISPPQDDIPSSLQLRAAIATALGAAAARAKLLADQEARKIENLVAAIIETQLKKVQCKIKHFDDLELIMEKEYADIEELKESLIEERIDVLQRAISAGVSKWRDHTPVKSLNGTVL